MRFWKVTSLALVLAAAATPSQAFLFLLAAGANREDKPSPPPTLRELPALNTDKAIRPSGLPAPHLVTPQTRAMPGLPLQLAQASPQDLQDLRKRLDQLEEENRRLRGQGGSPQATAPREGLPGTKLPAQVTSGWWVHLHNYNKEGDLGSGPVRTYRYDQQEFAATLAFKETNSSQWSEIHLYRFEAWLRAKEPGTYQIGALLNCAWEHPCNYSVMLDGIRIHEYKGQHGGTPNNLVYGVRHLEAGDYRMEMVFYIPKTNFLKYSPHKVTMRPQIRTVADMNFRDFNSSELLIPDRRDVPMGPAIQRTGW